MKKKSRSLKVSIPVIIFLVILLLMIIVLQKTVIGSQLFQSPKEAFVQQVPSAVTRTIRESSASINYEISVEYPEIEGLENPDDMMVVNLKIWSMMQQAIKNFKNQLSVNQQDSTGPITTSTLYIKYKLGEVSNNIVSVNFDISNYQTGAANPDNYNLPFNFNLQTVKEITLADLFKPGSNYLQVLSDYAKEDLARQNKKLDDDFTLFINEGTAPVAKNFQNFILGSDSVTFLFNPATVAPAYVGTQKVTIPFSKLTSVLNSNAVK